MIHIDFDPSRLLGEQKTWWTQWQATATAATREIIEKWERTGEISSKKDFDSDIWGELRKWLLIHYFKGKCGYCETILGRQRSEMEHYRPKAGVNYREYREDGKSPLKTPKVDWPPGTQIDHPGYFWLAYHWKNLVPSCGRCNSGAGKNTQFPVKESGKHMLLHPLTGGGPKRLSEPPHACGKHIGYYYLDPDSLDAHENPLLLNPYVPDPRKHLKFGVDGIEAAQEVAPGEVSLLGLNSINVYDLKSGELRALRAKAQNEAETLLFTQFSLAKMMHPRDEAWAVAFRATHDLLKALNGEYLAACLDWVELVFQDPSRIKLGARLPAN